MDGGTDGPSDSPNPTSTALSTLRTQNTHLLTQLNGALSAQRSAIAEVLKLDKERWERKEEEVRKAAVKRGRRMRRERVEAGRRRRVMGEIGVDVGMEDEEGEGEEGVSSDTDEVTENE